MLTQEGKITWGPTLNKELQAAKEFWEQEKYSSPLKSFWLVNQYQVLYIVMIEKQITLLE